MGNLAARAGSREKGSREVFKTGLDPAVLAQVAGKFEANRDLIREQLRIITEAVERTRPAWSGTAGMGFQTVGQMWGEQQERILRLLTETAQSIRDYGALSASATQQAEQEMKVHMDLPLDAKRGA
jgi:WXG100 family type VII secretion target